MQKASRAVVSLAGALALIAVLTGCSADPPGEPPSSYGTMVDQQVPASIQNIEFTTSTGAHTSLSMLRGKVIVLTDFLTTCSEACPMISANMRQMARTVSKAGLSDRVVFAEFSVDPLRDTPARMAAYRKLYGKTDNWMLLTTSPSNLKAFSKFFGIYYQRTKADTPPDRDWETGKPLTYDIAHQDAVIFLDSQGRERFLVVGQSDTQGATLPATMDQFLNTQGRENLTNPGPQSWTVPQGLQIVSWLLGKQVTP